MPVHLPQPRLPKFYETIQSGASRTGVSPRTLRRMIARGELVAYRLGPRLIRIDGGELDRVMQAIPGATAGGGA
jgi:excisionase family DNA binding protein